MFPSQYNPALSARDHWLYHPFTARTLATIAEITMYWIWATWVYQPFWGGPLGFIVCLGEIVCWCGILFQSNTIHLGEDTIWTIHASMMLYHSQTDIQYAVYGGFVLYMVLVHLPRQHAAMQTYSDCKLYKRVKVEIPD